MRYQKYFLIDMRCFIKSMNIRLLIPFFLIVYGGFLSADEYASEDFDFRKENTEAKLNIFTDYVNTVNGDLVIKNVDMDLPGNGGMDIRIYRTYSLLDQSASLQSTHNQSYKWAALGPGWSLRVAPRLVAKNSYTIVENFMLYYSAVPIDKFCSNSTFTQSGLGAPSLEFPDGSVYKLYAKDSDEAKTKNNWIVKCNESGEITVKSPNGIRYDYGSWNGRKVIGKFFTMDSLFYVPRSNPSIIPLEVATDTYIDPIKATDQFGNWVAFEYTNFGEPIEPCVPLPINQTKN